MLGGLELILIAFVLGVFGTFVWSLVDVLNRPAHQWKAVGQDKTLWLLVILFVGLPGSIAYLAAIRPKLVRAALAPMPAYPMLATAPPGWYPDPQGSGMLRWFDGTTWTQSYAPHGSVPMGGMPMGNAPMGGMPMSGAPMSGAPMSGAPMSGMPMSGAPPMGAPPSPGPGYYQGPYGPR